MTQQDGGVANSDGQNTADLNTNGQNNDNGGQNTDIQAQFIGRVSTRQKLIV